MDHVILYANGNSENHGCEALTRTVCNIFSGNTVLEYVNDTKSDQHYGIDQVVIRKELENKSSLSILERLVYKVAYKLKRHNIYNYYRYQDFLRSLKSDDILLSVGGDNYCYSDISWLHSLNYWISKRSKMVLLGASIEPDRLSSGYLREDLNRYALIIARESLTYEALVKHGFGDRTVLLPDPAFLLETEQTELPGGFVPGNTVGINISPMIMDYEENQGAAYQNYEELIQYILEHTDMSVALIPHVVWKNSDDRIPLQRLYDRFGGSGRVCMVEDQNCMRLKYIISQCRFFVGARTHATIAAYSTCVPTLVVGYSVKAKGIAKDLFGSYENYVIPVQNLAERDDLTKAFNWIVDQEEFVRQYLCKTAAECKDKVYQIRNEVYRLNT